MTPPEAYDHVGTSDSASAGVHLVRTAIESARADDAVAALSKAEAKALLARHAIRKIGFRLEYEYLADSDDPDQSWYVRLFDDKGNEIASAVADDPIGAVVSLGRFLVPPTTEGE